MTESVNTVSSVNLTQEEKTARLKELTALLSEAARVYEQEDREIMSNYEYDRLYDELAALEAELGTTLAGSPTQKVGYEVASELPKERHASPMLSLNKTKSREELADWLQDQKGVLSWKMDGLTIVLTYAGGELVKAVTRGNGETGEIVTANARTFKNLPLRIPYKGRLVLRGEAVIRYSDFEKINAAIPETESRYKNPRNLCSGSVRQLDSSVTAARNVRLYAFALILMEGKDSENINVSAVSSKDNAEALSGDADDTGRGISNKTERPDKEQVPAFTTRHEQLDFLAAQGFEVVERVIVDRESAAGAVESFASKISANDFPSDGLVLVYDDIAYGNSLGRTAKFPRDAIAFKWADEQAETVLREVEWSASRTGLINPVAIFDPVELEGTTVSRASLHNISIMEELRLGIGDRVTVYKANMIIPQIADNLTQSGSYRVIGKDCLTGNGSKDKSGCGDDSGDNTWIPIEGTDSVYSNPVVAGICPVCGMPTVIHDENDVRTLMCKNPSCAAKKIKLFSLAVSRDALNIDGMSEATIEKFINIGVLHELSDLFRMGEHRETISSLEGFGIKSCENLIAASAKASETTLDRVIYSLGIPNIGLANARLIVRYAEYDADRVPDLSAEELSGIDGIGPVLAGAFSDFFADDKNRREYRNLLSVLTLSTPERVETSGAIAGKTFVITGSVEHFLNRSEAKAFIEAHGGKVTGSVTKNTDYLVNNDVNSTSTKNKTAREIGIAIISEEELLELAGE